MVEPDKKSWVCVKANKDFFFIETYSGYWNCLPDDLGRQFILKPGVTDEELGFAVLDGLAASRQINPKNDPGFFDIGGRVVPQYHSWVDKIIAEFGYKNRRDMFKGMRNCLVEMVCDSIIMQPMHHEKLEAWSGKGIAETDYVVIPSQSHPVDVGQALRLAVSRCT
ncbi:contact-dependent growth inhibition system immunity protein [Pseudothauera rhizosphaerae]|uniref:DUF1436 family protein n=1 Tax=Pseudothauera rhizosphaerae TaxID=2565932 RepID=A0A4S4AUE7_9RHOO|nr:contact-dependent growth inhibition system immunity protein [Pseudothauera rhizosphaerae]THF63404.1 DUF1436 family protein [Pseudothauera rhizosphaerae]